METLIKRNEFRDSIKNILFAWTNRGDLWRAMHLIITAPFFGVAVAVNAIITKEVSSLPHVHVSLRIP